jgi:hypothetical protein
MFVLKHITTSKRGPGSSVSIVTGYGLKGPGFESRWGRDFPHFSTPGAHPACCTMGTGSFPGVKSGRSVTLTPHTLLVPWSWKSRAIPLLPLWAVRPVQSLSDCTRVHFTFFLPTSKCGRFLWHTILDAVQSAAQWQDRYFTAQSTCCQYNFVQYTTQKSIFLDPKKTLHGITVTMNKKRTSAFVFVQGNQCYQQLP